MICSISISDTGSSGIVDGTAAVQARAKLIFDALAKAVSKLLFNDTFGGERGNSGDSVRLRLEDEY